MMPSSSNSPNYLPSNTMTTTVSVEHTNDDKQSMLVVQPSKTFKERRSFGKCFVVTELD